MIIEINIMTLITDIKKDFIKKEENMIEVKVEIFTMKNIKTVIIIHIIEKIIMIEILINLVVKKLIKIIKKKEKKCVKDQDLILH